MLFILPAAVAALPAGVLLAAAIAIAIGGSDEAAVAAPNGPSALPNTTR